MAINNRTAVRRISLESEGRMQELRVEQVTVENLWRIFQVS